MKSPTKKSPAKKPRTKKPRAKKAAAAKTPVNKAASAKASVKKIPNKDARNRLVAYLCLIAVAAILFSLGRNAVEQQKIADQSAEATQRTEIARQDENASKTKKALKAKAAAQTATKAQAKATPTPKPKLPAKAAKNSPLISGGPYALTDQNGKTVTDADFYGGFTLVFFGYTFSPDVTPMGLDRIAETLRLLGKNAKKITPIFISVDPERDTPKDLKKYLAHFHPRIIGLTGSHDQISGALSAFKAYAIKTQGKDDYVIDHTSLIYLMGPDGGYRAHFNEDATPEDMAGQIRELM